MENIKMISLELLEAHPDNPRKEIGDIEELTESIKAHGIFQNLTVVPIEGTDHYRVIIGHRRMTAARAAGLTEVPCAVVEMDYKTQVATMLLENIQRTDLTAYEQAQGFQMMIDLGDTVDEISQKTGFSKTTVKKRLKIAELDGEVLKNYGTQISLTDLDMLGKVDDLKRRNEILLNDFGTGNFKWRIETAVNEQNFNKGIEKIKPKLDALGIKKKDSYDYRDKEVCTINLDNPVFPEKLKNYTDLVWYKGYRNDIQIKSVYKQSESEKKDEKKEKEKAARRKKRENALKDLARRCFESRKAFIFEKAKTIKADELSDIVAVLLAAPEYGSMNKDIIGEYLGFEKDHYTTSNEVKTVSGKRNKCEAALIMAYACSGDDERNFAHTTGAGFNPDPESYPRRNLLYLEKVLEKLGYKIPDEEGQYLDGTHEFYKM